MSKDLSTDIINKFAKVITQKQKVKSQNDTEIYGTIVESDDGTKCVRLDGSECDTPMVETMGCDVGDRVTVKISNHKALVTGNMSHPASSKIATNFAKIIDSGLMIGHLESGNPVGTYVVLKQNEYLILAEDGTVLASFSPDQSRLQTNNSSLILSEDQLNLNGPSETKFYINGKETTGGGETFAVSSIPVVRLEQILI